MLSKFSVKDVSYVCTTVIERKAWLILLRGWFYLYLQSCHIIIQTVQYTTSHHNSVDMLFENPDDFLFLIDCAIYEVRIADTCRLFIVVCTRYISVSWQLGRRYLLRG